VLRPVDSVTGCFIEEFNYAPVVGQIYTAVLARLEAQVCVCVCVWVYVWVYVCVCIYVCICMYYMLYVVYYMLCTMYYAPVVGQIYTAVLARLEAQVRMYIYIHIHTHTHTYTHTHAHTHTQTNKQTNTHTHIHRRFSTPLTHFNCPSVLLSYVLLSLPPTSYILNVFNLAFLTFLCAYLFLLCCYVLTTTTHTAIHTYIHTYTHTHTHTYTHTYIHTHTHTHTHTYTHTHTPIGHRPRDPRVRHPRYGYVTEYSIIVYSITTLYTLYTLYTPLRDPKSLVELFMNYDCDVEVCYKTTYKPI
jgi:hypothetical protein